MDQFMRNIFYQDFGKHETKIDDSASKKISCAKIHACTSKNIEPKYHVSLILYASSLKPSF